MERFSRVTSYEQHAFATIIASVLAFIIEQTYIYFKIKK